MPCSALHSTSAEFSGFCRFGPSAATNSAKAACRAVGVSSLAAGHLALAPALKRALREVGLGEAMIVVGGVIPEQDFKPLREAGVDAIFPPGTVIAEAAASLIEQLNQRLGYTQRRPA